MSRSGPIEPHHRVAWHNALMPAPVRDLALVGLLLSTTTFAFSCDGLLDEHRAPLSVEVAKTPPRTPSAAVVDDSGAGDGDVEMSLVESDASIVAIDGGDSGYQTMCRRYCATLEQTDLYHCLVGGGAPLDCATTVNGLTDQCVQLRCGPPDRVQKALCLTQCDALARSYDVYCAGSANDSGATELCPSSPSKHDLACRADC